MNDADEYWDPHAYLAMHQKIPCTFNNNIPGYGHLLRSTETILPANEILELPIHLAESLATKHVEYI